MIAWLVASAFARDVLIRDRATGDPVPGARVAVDGVPVGVTDDDGRFALAGVGVHAVTVEADERPTLRTALDFDRSAAARLFLDPPRADTEVVVEAFRDTQHVSRQALDAEQAFETPGAHEDAVRLVGALPGVTVQREYGPTAGDLSIRGSAPGDAVYLFDGIELPYLYHFNQYASVFPASQLASLELLPAPYGPAYGDAIGGVVAATPTLEPPEGVEGAVGLSFVAGGAELRAPVGRGVWASVAARRSFFDLLGESSAQYPVWPRFHDVQLRVESGDDKEGWGVFAVGAGDAWTRAAGELDVRDPYEVTITPDFSFSQGFWIGGVHGRWTDGRAVLAAVTTHRQGELATGGSEDFTEDRVEGRTTHRVRLTSDLALDVGADGHVGPALLTVIDPGPDAIAVADESPALARGQEVADRVVDGTASVWAGLGANFGDVHLEPGLRGTVSTHEPTLEPRMIARWSFGRSTEFRAGGGRITQRPPAEWQIGRKLPISDGLAAAAGVEQAVAGRLVLAAEGWVRSVDSPMESPIGAPIAVRDAAEAWGVEWTGRYRLRERFFLWAFAAVGRSWILDGDVRRPAAADQLAAGGVVASMDVGRTRLGLRWRSSTGLPYTPVAFGVYDANADTWLPVPDAIHSARMPAYHKVDARIATTWPMRGWALTVHGELWFVPPSATPLYPVWSSDWSEADFVRGPVILPLAGARATF